MKMGKLFFILNTSNLYKNLQEKYFRSSKREEFLRLLLVSPYCPAGWSGSGGLGAKEQGIQDPIKGGDVRDKWDQYKGVGVSLDDPYENYRRNKSYNFVARMKAREEGMCTDHVHHVAFKL